MQFYADGFRPGDPAVAPSALGHETQPPLPGEVDVLVVGCGPAGLVLAAQLSAFGDINTRIVDARLGPLERGQADGVACRTVEMFDAFGLSGKLLAEGQWVNETVFWRPDARDRTRIVRSGRVPDGWEELSEFPHLIVNQARLQSHLLDFMRCSPRRLEPDYGMQVTDVAVHLSGYHPVAVTLASTDPARQGDQVSVRAKYVVGCDGARSVVRRSIAQVLRGDSANKAWGVMDVLARTDFPDIRFKALVQSAAEGNLLIIPREGGFLVRCYIELDELAPDERLSARSVTADDLIAAANRILRPFTLDVRDVAWWSVYEIGQRVADRFDDVPSDEVGTRNPRAFIAGDACHTHSPKAGQGMNVSMQDSFNLGWKLAAVLQGRCQAELLRTYSEERRSIAHELIAFDREWSRIISTPPKDPDDADSQGVDPEEVRAYYAQSGRYTAGVATRYAPSMLTDGGLHQPLATGFVIGERFHSAPVLRICDAKPMHLGHVAQADGRWRLYAFADARDVSDPESRLAAFCSALLDGDSSLIRQFTPSGADLDAVFDVRAVLQQDHRQVTVADLPPVLRPARGRFGLVDYEKAFAADVQRGDVFDLRGIDRQAGCVVLVRPDQYVAGVFSLASADELTAYFAQFMRKVASMSRS